VFREVFLGSRREIAASLRVLGGADGFVVMSLDICVPVFLVRNPANIRCFIET
jgi:hypothetical protein